MYKMLKRFHRTGLILYQKRVLVLLEFFYRENIPIVQKEVEPTIHDFSINNVYLFRMLFSCTSIYSSKLISYFSSVIKYVNKM